MDYVNNVQSLKNKTCHDCGKKIIIENKEIKNGKLLVYDVGDKMVQIFKCNECFAKLQELRNFRKCEVYSRIVGYIRPVQEWNVAKQDEFGKREVFDYKKLLNNQ